MIQGSSVEEDKGTSKEIKEKPDSLRQHLKSMDLE